jgi:hypothetical protein
LLEVRLETLLAENELLAELNENLRRWLVANTDAAVAASRSMGFGEGKE